MLCRSMKRARLNPRKLLIALAGVATVNYAFAAGCGGKSEQTSVIANLLPGPPYVSNGGAGPTVANLLAPPSMYGTGGQDPGPVANLVAPPPEPPVVPPVIPVTDAAAPDADVPSEGLVL